ncbi:hypothetical protein DFH29DRAFT_963505, partial [Suillus ampliporus]
TSSSCLFIIVLTLSASWPSLSSPTPHTATLMRGSRTRSRHLNGSNHRSANLVATQPMSPSTGTAPAAPPWSYT